MMSLTVLVLVVIAALAFDFINGFHDTANAIATVVSTGVMRARSAIMMAAVFNVLGAFLGTAVATTISKDLVDASVVTQPLVLSALIAAIVWNLITWRSGIPSSSSHALVGGLVGAGFAVGGFHAIHPAGLEKVVIALVLSPVLGFSGAFAAMIVETWVVRRMAPVRVNRVFRFLQLFSSAFLALSHGLNDAQKTMGVITMALIAYHGQSVAGPATIPTWVIGSCALAMGLGTSAGGWRIIHTMGNKIFKMRAIHGFTANASAAIVIQIASAFGLPTSTTHCMTAAIMGAGATTRLSAVRWGVTRQIVTAWVLTIPMCAALGGGLYRLWLVFT